MTTKPDILAGYSDKPSLLIKADVEGLLSFKAANAPEKISGHNAFDKQNYAGKGKISKSPRITP